MFINLLMIEGLPLESSITVCKYFMVGKHPPSVAWSKNSIKTMPY